MPHFLLSFQLWSSARRFLGFNLSSNHSFPSLFLHVKIISYIWSFGSKQPHLKQSGAFLHFYSSFQRLLCSLFAVFSLESFNARGNISFLLPKYRTELWNDGLVAYLYQVVTMVFPWNPSPVDEISLFVKLVSPDPAAEPMAKFGP